jgi:pimeloyl-ACP methyl ester carboxylesterase
VFIADSDNFSNHVILEYDDILEEGRIMQKVVTNFVRALAFCILGVLLVTLRYVLRTPQPLESALPGEPRLYKWKYGHVYYKVLGATDAPPIVLLHAPGIGASSYEMRGLVEGLAQRYRVYALDLLGFGLSDHPKIDYSGEMYVSLYRDFLTAVVARPATLLASGLSCNYCVALASRAPDLYERLIFLSPLSLFTRFTSEGKQHWFSDLVQLPLVDLVIYSFLTTPIILRSLIARRQGIDENQVTASCLHAVDAAAHQLGAEYAGIACIAGKLALDVSCQLETLQQPTLIVWGAHALTSIHFISDSPSTPTHTQVVLIQDAGPYVQEERPRQVVANILDWQTGVPADRHGKDNCIDSSSAETDEANLRHAHEVTEASTTTPSTATLVIPSIETVEAYCARCRHKQPVQNPREIVTKTGRRALEGNCPVCGTKLFRFIAG